MSNRFNRYRRLNERITLRVAAATNTAIDRGTPRQSARLVRLVHSDAIQELRHARCALRAPTRTRCDSAHAHQGGQKTCSNLFTLAGQLRQYIRNTPMFRLSRIPQSPQSSPVWRLPFVSPLSTRIESSVPPANCAEEGFWRLLPEVATTLLSVSLPLSLELTSPTFQLAFGPRFFERRPTQN